MYAAPPFPDEAVHDVNVRSFNVILLCAVIFTHSAPPFPDVDTQEMNWRLESVCDEDVVVNSNTAPFPLPRVIDLNVFVPSVLSNSIDTSIKGAPDVVVDAVDVNVIPLNSSVPDVTAINEHPLLI